MTRRLVPLNSALLWHVCALLLYLFMSMSVFYHGHLCPFPALWSPTRKSRLALQSTASHWKRNETHVSSCYTGPGVSKANCTYGLLKLALMRRLICSRSILAARSFFKSEVLTLILDRST